MKDGSAAVVISVDAMNFGLLAEEEQDAVMYAYAGLLNSLNYPIQVVVRSQTKDVTSYLNLLESQEQKTTHEVMRKRIQIYREFVGNLIHERNVLDKKFYVTVPATSTELGLLAASSVLPGQGTVDVKSIEKSVLVEKAINALEPKRDHLISQFARIGLYSRQLTTQEIIQLFYLSYNPEAAEGQNITDSSNYTTPLVQPATAESLAEQAAVAQAAPIQQQANQMPVQNTPQTGQASAVHVAQTPAPPMQNQQQAAPQPAANQAAPPVQNELPKQPLQTQSPQVASL